MEEELGTYRWLDIFMFIKITTCLFKYIHGQDTITDPSLYIMGVGKKTQFTFPFIRRLYAILPCLDRCVS